jgi:hypothetical protein
MGQKINVESLWEGGGGLKRRDSLENLVVDDSIIFKCVLKK